MNILIKKKNYSVCVLFFFFCSFCSTNYKHNVRWNCICIELNLQGEVSVNHMSTFFWLCFCYWGSSSFFWHWQRTKRPVMFPDRRLFLSDLVSDLFIWCCCVTNESWIISWSYNGILVLDKWIKYIYCVS